jgi:hypothetical protein
VTKFMRVFIDHELGRVGVEVALGQLWTLPNPTPEGKTYAPTAIMRAVISAGRVDLARWERLK